MTKEERRLDLSNKLLKMGEALGKEGVESNDGCVLTTGSSLIFMSKIILSENYMYLFGELASMFSAKIILDNIDDTQSKITEDGFINNIITKIETPTPVTPKSKSKRRKGNNGDSETES